MASLCRSSAVGCPLSAQASSEKCSGKLPRKKLVSTTTPRIIPGNPRRMMHQSKPGVRRRRVSQPSIHFPRSVYLPSIKTGALGLSRFSLGAKNSSLATSTAPPSFSEARSTSSVKSISLLTFGVKDKQSAACLRLRHVRRACRIVNEAAGRIIADPVVEDAGNHINLFGSGLMEIDFVPASAGIELNDLGCRSVRRLPKGSHSDRSSEFLFYGRVFKSR